MQASALPVVFCLCVVHANTAYAGHNDEPVGFERRQPPNIILFMADDLGWGDLSVYGNPTQEPGPIDRMAAEGVRFTQMYASATFCTPSRASLLTGRYPFRTGMYGPTSVHLPQHFVGLPHEEVTIAEALRDRANYFTGIIGKWHLGTNLGKYDDGYFLPNTHGFQYVGTILPFSLIWNCDTEKKHRKQPLRHSCYLYRNTTIVEQPIDLSTLTHRLVLDAREFLYSSKRSQPFFLIMSLPQTHTPMFNSPEFKNRSRRGVYGDQVNEMSWAVGQVLDVIRDLDIERETLAMFISDHGPHLEIGNEGGSSGTFREGKGHYGEGGLRVPGIAWWPGTIPAGRVSADVLSLMDLLPTFLEAAGVSLVNSTGHRNLDGRSFFSLLRQDKDKDDDDLRPRQTSRLLHFYCDDQLVASRVGRYKVYFRKSQFLNSHQLSSLVTDGGFPLVNYMAHRCPTELLDPWVVYDVETDPAEAWPVSPSRLDAAVVSSLWEMLELSRPAGDHIAAMLTPRNLRRHLSPCCNPPYCWCRDEVKFPYL